MYKVWDLNVSHGYLMEPGKFMVSVKFEFKNIRVGKGSSALAVFKKRASPKKNSLDFSNNTKKNKF